MRVPELRAEATYVYAQKPRFQSTQIPSTRIKCQQICITNIRTDSLKYIIVVAIHWKLSVKNYILKI